MGFKNRCAELFKHLALLCLFIFLPILVAAGLGYHTLLLERERQAANISRQLENNLVKVGSDTRVEVFMKMVACGAWKMVKRAGDDQQKLLDFNRSLEAFLPVDFDLYAFNSHGELITPAQISLKSRFLGSRLWDLTRCDPIEQGQRYQKIRRQLKAFLGNEFRIAQFLEGRNSMIPIIRQQKQGFVYWINEPDNPACGILMIFWDIPDTGFRLRQILKKIGRKFVGGFIAKSETEITRFGDFAPDNAFCEDLFRKIAFLNQREIYDGRMHIWSGRQIESFWVIGSLDSGLAWFDRLQNVLLIILVLAVALAMYVYLHASSLFVSIRIKLLGLFLVAVLSPVRGFAYLGYRYLGDREATLASQVANQGRQLLVDFDESFRNAGADFIDEFRQLSSIAADPETPGARSMLKSRLLSNNLITFELRNASSAEMLFSLQNELVFEGMREVSDAFSRFCLDNAFGSNLTAKVDPLLDMAVRSPEAGMWFLFDRPDEVHRLAFGPVPMFIFWNTVRRLSDSQLVHVYILQSATRLTQQLIHRRLLARLKEKSPFTLAVMSQKNDAWLPGKVHENSQLRDFAARLLFSEKPDEIRLSLGGEEYLVSAQRGKYFGSYSLFAFYPYRLIAEEISMLRHRILLAMLVFTVLALLAAWLLSDTFLLPVARLGQGVDAIKARNSDFRIDQSQQDEFGDLAASFNHMIADLKEMQLARDVQEALLPAKVPALKGYRLGFANRMASAVGGDYFDVQILDANNIFVIIGDVTGHGVGSALVMSMAKAIVYHGLKEGRDLISIFNDLNLTVHSYFSRPPVRRMITMFAAVINLPTGVGGFVNAGHNFPIKVSASGECNDLKSVHLPIGAVSELKRMKTSPLQIAPGETILFYTDGLIEAVNHEKEQYGYERLKACLSASTGTEPEELADRLLLAYDSWLAGNEPDDDVTLVILCREPGA